ncbi:transposase [Pleurocapsales cyanobacterium LEGE 10410]|nr:transposase [Pleurocapsales cyanobacterium LEGE 10410]
MINAIFSQFIEATPITVMVRGIMERIFEPTALDELFEAHAVKQYTRELLFSNVVSLMSLVVSGIHPSVSAAYKALEKDLGVSRPALYGKLNGMELGISQALVRYSASNLESLICELKVNETQLLAGYEVRIADGNHLSRTEHRLKVLRNNLSKALPGKSIAVLDPQKMLVTDIFLNQDGHAQERTMLPELLETIQAQQIWIADRNFCTRQFLSGIAQKGSYFIIRQHKSLPIKEISPLEEIGITKTGRVFEQKIQIAKDNTSLNLRRVVVQLNKPTRHGDEEVAILTHLPISVADAPTIARLYLKRWNIEGMFQVITDTFNCELNTLGYPKAALFVFCVAIVAFNILSTVKAALKSVHGVGKIEAGFSDYYLVEEVQATYRGMAIALPAPLWLPITQMGLTEFAQALKQWASLVELKRFCSSPRQQKKKKPKPTYDPKHPHRSTARLLQQHKQYKRSP